MSSRTSRGIRSVEELTSEENERLRRLSDADRMPRRFKDMHFDRVLAICFALAAFLVVALSLANHLSLQTAVLLFLGTFAILLVLFSLVFALGSRSIKY